MKIKNILLALCFAVCVVLPSFAAEQSNAVVIYDSQSGKVTYMLDESPVISFSGEDMVMTTPKGVITYPSEKVERLSFEYVDPTGVDEVRKDHPIFYYNQNVLLCKALTPNSKVAIWGVDGKIVNEGNADEDGNFSISLESIPSGIYIVKASSITFKIIK